MCKRPGGATVLNPTDIGCGRQYLCARCTLSAHNVCMQWRSRKLYCLPCCAIVKAEQAAKPRVPSNRKLAGLSIPHKLRKHVSEQEWVAIHCKDEMNTVIARTMRRLGYQSWTELQQKVQNQNRSNKAAQRLWTTWSEDKQQAHKTARNALAAERLEYVKTFRILTKEYLRTTSSAIPDLRYDRNKKRFIGRAVWKTDDDNGCISLNQQEVELSPTFVERNFPLRVLNYVRRACLMSKGDFLPVPTKVTLELDLRVVTHCKWQAGIDADDCVVFKYSDRTHESVPTTEALARWGSTYMDLLKQSRKGFIHIPPGASIPARIEAAPMQTKRCQRIPIQFLQGDLPTCVRSGFASALWAVGLTELATQINATATASVDDPLVLQHVARDIENCGSWLQPHKIKNVASFDLLTTDLTDTLAVLILKSSDGATMHAITVHDNVIFDSNECTGLPLCQANLNYLCSTPSRQAQFAGVMAGYCFREQGNKQQLLRTKQSIHGNPWQS